MAVATRTHYEVLGVSPDASAATIRDAYRRRAREHHPDRARSAVGASSQAMPEVNEAYRVLKDPARRAMYDASLRGSRSGPASPPRVDDEEYAPPPPPTYSHRPFEPARVPWRGLLFCGVVAAVGIIALSQFIEPAADPGPDGILRIGDCVTIEANGDAREVACTGEDDLVVDAFIPFDADCPGGTSAHRDRQGMGVACVDPP